MINVLEQIEKRRGANLDKYKIFVKNKYATLRMAVAVNFKDSKVFDENFNYKKKHGTITKKDKFLLMRRKSKLINGAYLTLRNIDRKRKGGKS